MKAMKRRKKKYRCTPEMRELIIELGKKGMPDTEIQRQLGTVPIGTITGTTTRYWEQKMQEKQI